MATTEHIMRIIEEARKQGMSQGELAARVGIRPETLSRAKKQPNISLNTFEQMAHVVGLRLQLIPDNPVAEQVSEGTLFPSSS